MHIMLALDDSRHAHTIVQWMKTFPPPAGARLTLVHVLEPPDVPGEPAMTSAVRRRQHAEAEGFLARASRLLDKCYSEVRYVIIEGFPVYQMLSAIREYRPDLVVSGTRGLRGAKGLTLGSVSQRLLTYAPCSVMLVPPRVRSGRRFKVLLATDGSRGAKEAARFLTHLPDLKEVKVLTTLKPVEMRDLLVFDNTVKRDTRTLRAEISRSRRAAAQRALDDTLRVLRPAALTLKTGIVTGHPAEAIPREAKKDKCSLLVIGSRGLAGAMAVVLGSVSLAVAQSAPCPVLVVKRRV